MARKDAHVVTAEKGTPELEVHIRGNTDEFKAMEMKEVNQEFYKVSGPSSKKDR